VEEAEEVLHLHLVAGDVTTEVLNPGEKPLHLPAAAISTQLTFILSLRLAPSTVRGNQLHSPLVPQSLVEFVSVIGLVADEPLGKLVDEALVERSFEELGFVGRSACRANGERKTRAVCSCHDLRPFAPLRFPDAGPPFFADAKYASTKPSSRSNPPRSLRSRAKARRAARKVPSLIQP